MLTNGGWTDFQDLSVVVADLIHAQNWDQVMVDADYAIHVASPTPTLNFKDESEMIQPAIHGVLYVLQAASKPARKSLQ